MIEIQKQTTGSVPLLLVGCIIFPLFMATVGCTWRTAGSEHFIGPMLLRATQPSSGKTYLWEERSVLPIIIEGGNHNSVTLGFSSRVVAAPIEHDKDGMLMWCSGLFPFSCSTPTAADGWHWNGLYSRLVHNLQPEFYNRTVWGASLGVGSEGQYLTIGYSADTRLKPRDEAYYIFCYRNNSPLTTRFEIARDTTEFSTFLHQEACE